MSDAYAILAKEFGGDTEVVVAIVANGEAAHVLADALRKRKLNKRGVAYRYEKVRVCAVDDIADQPSNS
jgi:hypothetical protein